MRFLNQDWEISILFRHHLPVPKVLIKIKKSVETWNCLQILTVCLNLDRELVDFSINFNQELSRFLNLKSWKCRDILINVEKSWQFSKSLHNLYKSRLSWFIQVILMQISTWQSLNWKVSILKISTETKKILVLTWRTILISIGLNCRVSTPPRFVVVTKLGQNSLNLTYLHFFCIGLNYI